jgi:hypothetical protein
MMMDQWNLDSDLYDPEISDFGQSSFFEIPIFTSFGPVTPTPCSGSSFLSYDLSEDRLNFLCGDGKPARPKSPRQAIGFPLSIESLRLETRKNIVPGFRPIPVRCVQA